MRLCLNLTGNLSPFQVEWFRDSWAAYRGPERQRTALYCSNCGYDHMLEPPSDVQPYEVPCPDCKKPAPLIMDEVAGQLPLFERATA